MALTITGTGGLCLLVGRDPARPHRRQLRPGRGARRGRRDPRPSALPADADPDPARRADEERAVSVPFLAAQRHGGADAGIGLSALRHHGEGRRLPAGAALADPVGNAANGSGILGLAGITSLVLGAYLAIFQRDLKGLLAYSTISHLGLITTLLSLGSPLAAVAAIFHMVNHATFKASLFMAAGIIDHETGTRDMQQAERAVPLHAASPATLAMVACAAMAGVPLLNGFLSKEMFFAEARRDPCGFAPRPRRCPTSRRSPAPSASPIRSASSTRSSSDRRRRTSRRTRTSRRAGCVFPIEFLVLACLIVGIVPGMSIGPFLSTAVVSVLGTDTPQYSLAVWHGVNAAAAHERRRAGRRHAALFRPAATTSQRCEDGPPLFRRLSGQRIFERILVDRVLAMGALAWRAISAPGGCSRSCARGRRSAFAAAALPLLISARFRPRAAAACPASIRPSR